MGEEARVGKQQPKQLQPSTHLQIIGSILVYFWGGKVNNAVTNHVLCIAPDCLECTTFFGVPRYDEAQPEGRDADDVFLFTRDGSPWFPYEVSRMSKVRMLSWQWVSTEDRQLGSLSGSHGSRWRSWRRPRIRPYSHLPTYAANKLAVAVFSRAPTPTAHIETTVVKHSINQVCSFVFFLFCGSTPHGGCCGVQVEDASHICLDRCC